MAAFCMPWAGRPGPGLRGSAAFWLAVLVVLAAHAVLARWVGPALKSSAGWSAPARTISTATRAGAAALHVIVRQPAWPLSTAQQPPAQVASPPLQQPAQLTRAGPMHPIRYWLSSEVDLPARPIDAWALDPDAPELRGVRKLAFDVLINARGGVDGCLVLQIEPDRPGVVSWVQAQLSTTRMLPAQANGRAVPSRRLIELAFDRD